MLRRRRRFGVSQEYSDARTRIASDGAKLLPYALVPTPDEYGLGGFEKRLPRDAFACVALIELQAYVDLGKSSQLIRNCEAITSFVVELVANCSCIARRPDSSIRTLNGLITTQRTPAHRKRASIAPKFERAQIYGQHPSDEEIDVPKAVPDEDAEGEEVPGAAEGHAKIYHQEFTLEKANYCSKMGIMLDGHDDIDVYNLGVSGATAQSDTDIPWVKQPAYDDYKNHYRCDVAIVQLGTNDAKRRATVPPIRRWTRCWPRVSPERELSFHAIHPHS